ncbi:phosphatidate cytidylyltransferase [Thiohalorhabdus sp.]|uniref:phosphatidate cytidylyltransferase n=1 Tax=Thiohalorhabdus sp. TaxID=3094134 RepID=UPI002FC2C390
MSRPWKRPSRASASVNADSAAPVVRSIRSQAIKARLLTAIVLIALALVGIFYLPPMGILALGLILALLAGLEWAELSHIHRRWAQWPFALLVVAATAVLTGLRPEALAAAALVWWLLVAAEIPVFWPQTDELAYRAANGLAGLATLGPALALLVVLVRESPWEAVTLLVAVWAADVGAYAVGSFLGRHRLVPHISPGKTWEGLIGGAVLGAAAAGAMAWGASEVGPIPVFAGIGALVALVGQVGDLAVSMIKRRAGRKDSGRFLPGHGGILDRIDSLTAAVPVYVLCLRGVGL